LKLLAKTEMQIMKRIVGKIINAISRFLFICRIYSIR